MKKFYTYVLVSLIIFASLSISPVIVQADDGIGPKIVDVSFDRTKLTRGQKVELVVNAEDTNGLASSDYGHEFLPPLTFYLPPNAMFGTTQ